MLVGLRKDRPSADGEQHYCEGNQGERPGSSLYDNRALVARLHVGGSSTADVTFSRSRRCEDTTPYAPSVIIIRLRSAAFETTHATRIPTRLQAT
jgi:hypothetical protein